MPTWGVPVGEGQKRTRTSDVGLVMSPIVVQRRIAALAAPLGGN